jgi:Fe2+ transport system protein FeoA
MTVFDLKVGERAVVSQIECGGATTMRLRSLGIVAGKEVSVLAFSFFQSSVLVGCGNVRVGMRKRLAQKITVSIPKQQEATSPKQYTNKIHTPNTTRKAGGKKWHF